MLNQGLYTAEAVQAIVEQAVLEAKANDEKTLKVLLQRPNGRSAIRGYVRRHTVKYAGNFNKQMIARKREKEQAQRSLQDCSITSPMLFTTLLESADDLGEDPYI